MNPRAKGRSARFASIRGLGISFRAQHQHGPTITPLIWIFDICKYFVVVAEELHFTRAAERLNIGQPPLSQTIQRLENELGVLLFHRGTRRVQLTEAGSSFLKNARTILTLTEEAKLSMQQYGRGERGSIRTGFTGSASFNPFVSRAISAFRTAFPEVEVALSEAATAELLPQLRDARVDVAFVRPSPGETSGLREQFLFNETMMLALPIGHRLATRPVSHCGFSPVSLL